MERMRVGVFLMACLLLPHCGYPAHGAAAASENWPQFRGPNASGVAPGDHALPVEFGVDRNVAWKTAVPSGHSSPCIWGDRIFLTAFSPESRKLEVLCLDRNSGKLLWRRDAPAERIENVHSVSNPATATPATDGERVYAYFGSCGLLCFDFAGDLKWSVPLPVAATRFGSGTSPIVTGEQVILNRDTGPEAYLLAVDRRTGKTLWKQAHAPSLRPVGECYSTPVVWNGQLLLHRSGEIAAYDLRDGKPRWSVHSDTSGTSTPVVTETAAYVGTWNNFGEPDQRPSMPDFAALRKEYDKNGDGRISEAEFPADLYLFRRPEADPNIKGVNFSIKAFFRSLDRNQDGQLDEAEWQSVLTLMAMNVRDHGLLAIRPGGEGDVTATHVLWQEKRSVPEVPSPLVYRDRVYMVRDGGIVSCMEAKTGKLLYRERLGAAGSYFSSPVASGGRVYVASGDGKVVVFTAGDRLEVLARNDLQEPIMATPGIVGDRLYLRTAGHLYAFAAK
jgi:outer membrane protein assembly factor BamB